MRGRFQSRNICFKNHIKRQTGEASPLGPMWEWARTLKNCGDTKGYIYLFLISYTAYIKDYYKTHFLYVPPLKRRHSSLTFPLFRIRKRARAHTHTIKISLFQNKATAVSMGLLNQVRETWKFVMVHNVLETFKTKRKWNWNPEPHHLSCAERSGFMLRIFYFVTVPMASTFQQSGIKQNIILLSKGIV